MEERPLISAPSVFPPENGPEILDGEVEIASGVRFTKSHYWRRIFAAEVHCGQTDEISFTHKIGITKTELDELTSGLSLPIGALASSLSVKSGTSLAVADERTSQYKKTITAPRCSSLTYVEWQQVERIKITRPRRKWFWRNGREETRSLDNPLNVFCPDSLISPKPDCCQDELRAKLTQGFDQLYMVSFPEMKVVSLARRNQDETISFADVPGAWKPGAFLNADVFAPLFRAIGQEPEGKRGRLADLELASGWSLLSNQLPPVVSRDQAWDVCPSVSELRKLCHARSPQESLSAWHLRKTGCVRCNAILKFLTVNRGWRQSELDGCEATIIAMSVSDPPDAPRSAIIGQTVLRQIQTRLSLIRLGKDVMVRVLSWNGDDVGRELEIAMLGTTPVSFRVTLADSGFGLAAGEYRLGSYRQQGAVPVLVSKRGLKKSTALAKQKQVVDQDLTAAGEALGLAAEPVKEENPLIVGVISEVNEEALIVDLTGSTLLHAGDTFRVFQQRLFIGIAVVSESSGEVANCKFQTADSETARPGDVLMFGSEE
jgi:hypothetical protein